MSRPVALWCWQLAPDLVMARMAFCGAHEHGYSAVRKSAPAAIAAVKEEIEREGLPVVEAEDPQSRSRARSR